MMSNEFMINLISLQIISGGKYKPKYGTVIEIGRTE